MKMPAGLLFRRATGMENRGAFIGRETSQIQFLERRRRHGGNLRPMFDGFRRKIPGLANLPIRGVKFELKCKEFEGGPIKISEGRVTRSPLIAFHIRASWNSALRKNGLAQTRGEI